MRFNLLISIIWLSSVAGLDLNPLTFFHRLFQRDGTISTTLPGNYTLLGCFTDSPVGSTLEGSTFTNTVNMTQELCTEFCESEGWIFAGVEFGQDCFCGNNTSTGSVSVNVSDCNIPCVGNASETCGGTSRIELFSNGMEPLPPPMTVSSFGPWKFLGCFVDDATFPALPSRIVFLNGSMTVEACLNTCFNANFLFSLGGLESGSQCFCGRQLSQNISAPLDECNSPCQGNMSEFCGGPQRLGLYNFTGIFPVTPIQGF